MHLQGPVTSMFNDVVQIALNLTTTLTAILLYSPVFFFPGIVVALVGAVVGKMYMAAQLSVKREMSNAKSPIYSNFGASVAGLVTIRAFGVEGAFNTESRKRIDYYSRPARTFWNLNRWVEVNSRRTEKAESRKNVLSWISVRMDALGALFGAALAAYLVYGPGESLRSCIVALYLKEFFLVFRHGCKYHWIFAVDGFPIYRSTVVGCPNHERV